MTRFVLLAFLGLGVGVSRAEGMLPDGSTLKFNKLLLHEHNSPDLAEPETDPTSVQHYFNMAHCLCSQANLDPADADPAFHENTFAWEVVVENSTAPVDHPIEVWTGADCNTTDTVTRNANCHKVVTTSNISAIVSTNGTKVEIPVFDLLTPKTEDRVVTNGVAPGCRARKLSAATWLLVDANPADGTFDYNQSIAIDTDTEAPPLPTDISAIGAESAIELSWTPPTDVSDVFTYQALCATSTGSPAKTNPPKPQYTTADQLCGKGGSVTLFPIDLPPITDPNAPDAGTATVDIAPLGSLDPSFICGEQASATAKSMRIDGLQNGVPYTVMLLTIDKSGNAAATYFRQPITPVPSTDFWEDLQGQGSGVQGGFCLLSQTYGDDNPLTNTLRDFRDDTLGDTAYGRWLVDVYYGTLGAIDLHGVFVLRIVAGVLLLPLVALALLWHLLTLPGLLALVALGVLVRRRRVVRARLALAATVAVIALLPARAAHAQKPYWEEPSVVDEQSAALAVGDPERVSWHAGIRVGPYTPGIDAQLDMPAGGFAGPFEQMFGGSTWMPVLDVDWILFRGFGQAGIGVSIGYMGKKAHPWKAGSLPSDVPRDRATGDENRFRLFPMSLNAVYRFTYFDDEYGVPLVPYVRGGLAYDVWWATAPNGDFAKTCINGGMEPCQTTTAAGASMGLVGSLGLSIRAERIDESAARSMRESGIEHAGFYAEYSLGWVDGFGSSKKLSVGDATWFAGVDFEF